MAIVRIKFSAILFLCWFSSNAQPGAGDPNGGSKPGTVPISGIEILLAAGTLFGASRFFKNPKKRS